MTFVVHLVCSFSSYVALGRPSISRRGALGPVCVSLLPTQARRGLVLASWDVLRRATAALVLMGLGDPPRPSWRIYLRKLVLLMLGPASPPVTFCGDPHPPGGTSPC